MTPEDQWQWFDPDEEPSQRVYGLLTSVVVPRPIAWVSSQNEAGVLNVAPHSFFTVLGQNPPRLGFVSVREKDTLRNIRATGEFVINIAGEEIGDLLNLTAADFPASESEFHWAGLTPLFSRKVTAPGVAEASVVMEARLEQVIPFVGEPPYFLVVGEVVQMRIADRVMDGRHVDPARLRALGRLAGSTYTRTTDLLEMPRPTYAGLLEAGASPRGDGDA